MKVKEVAQAASLPIMPDSMAAAYRFLDLRVQELLSVPIKPLRQLHELVVPATITAGTISVTSGTNVVTGNAAASSAWASTNFDHRYFRADDSSPWYEIAFVVNTDLRLISTYVGDTVTDGDYTIAKRFCPLQKGVTRIGTMVNMNNGTPLERRSQEELNMLVPMRSTVTGGPTVFSEFGVDLEGRKLFEFYPYHDSDVIIAYTSYDRPGNLRPDDELPDYIDPYTIQEGIKMDLYEMASNKAYNQGEIEKANSLANIRARQRTIWMEAKRNWYMQVEAVDDAQFILESYGRTKSMRGDIQTARDHILARWNPLT